MALDPSYIVRVREQIAPDASRARDFSKTLFLHTPPASADADVLRRHAQVRSYSGVEAVEVEWGSTSAPAVAARVYFAQVPYPGPLAVASYFSAARGGSIDGESITTDQATVRAFGDSAPLTLFGVAITADVDSVTTPASVATALQTGINAQANITGVSVSATGTMINQAQTYTITLPAALASVTALDMTQGITGPLADHLGLTDAAGGVFARPFAQDTSVADALTRASELDGDFYMVTMSPELDGVAANIAAASGWAEPRTHVFGFESSDEGSLDPSNTTSPIVVAGVAERKRTFGVFTRNRDGKALSIAARFSSVNYDGLGTNINLAHKTLPSTLPDTLNEAQVDTLNLRGANAYTSVAGSARLLFGRAASGFIDARVWTDWFVSRLQSRVLDLLGSSNLIPMSERGYSQLLTAVIDVCDRGRANNGFTPGTLAPELTGSVRQITGNDGFNGDVPNGYFAYIARPEFADLDNRVAPPIYVWGLYRGGVNRVNIDIALGG